MAEKQSNKRGHRFKDLTGKRFHRLKVISLAGFTNNKAAIWCCMCDCGTTKNILSSGLIRGTSRSCGCYQIENARLLNTKHGLSRTKESQSWHHAKRRCYDPNDKAYEHYGGRGITMCDKWRNSFPAFLGDMGKCPQGFELDRIDNDGNYEPGNCRWTDRKTQTRNQRRSIYIAHDGETLCLKDWSVKTGINYGVLLKRYHDGTELFEPVRKQGHPWPRLKRRQVE